MQCPSELELLAWLIDTVTPEQVYKAFCMALHFKSLSFPLWQGCLFSAHTSLSFTFTWGVAYNYCLVNSFFAISMMFKDNRVQKGPGEGKSLVSREWQIATRERKGKKRKGNTWQSTRPLSTSRPLFHHQVSLMLWVALSLWYHDVCGHICQPHCLDPLYCFVKSFTIKVTASNTTIWFPRVTNILHNRKAIISPTES